MKKRLISAIVMIILFVPIVYFGGLPYKVLFAILGLLGLKEILDLKKNIPFILKISAYFFALYLILYNHSDMTLVYLLNYKILIGIFVFYLLSVVIFGEIKTYNYQDAIFIIGAIILIGISFNGFIIVRNLGYIEIFYLFLVSSITDTFAYFIGSFLGKHKLAKNISPNKTVEGFIGGSLLGTIFTTLIYCILVANFHNFVYTLGITFILSILGQLGDLSFSSIKRTYKIKDFSNLIPGHGGILDRLDSVIFILLGYILIIL